MRHRSHDSALPGPRHRGPFCCLVPIRFALSLFAVCLLGQMGCSPRETVTVNGAVSAPGPVSHQPGWRIGDYVARVGGYTVEADTGSVRLVRWPPSSDGASLDYDLRQSWPVGQAPDVAAGDHIDVPRRAYPVRLDTVRQVRDVAVTYLDRVYRIPSGVLVPGWTDRGVTAAVVIGEGQVLRDGKPATRFHYLYLRMHPDRYFAVLPATGPVLNNRDMLEDAVAIHHNLLSRSPYVSEGDAQIPPEGYLFAQAGVWLNPKQPGNPGPGMRRRRYPDGRVWTTFPDGRQRMQYPDGRTEMSFLDGATEVRYADGRVAFTDASGARHTRYPDGREVWVLPSGNRVASLPNGMRRYDWTNGTVRFVTPDGKDSTRFVDGIVHVSYPDGRVALTDSAGNRELRHPDGRIEVATVEGHLVQMYPDGRQVTRMRDGTLVEDFPDGRRVQRNTTGDMIEVQADGRRRITYGTGEEMTQGGDGVSRIQYPDDGRLEIHPDGRGLLNDGDGRTLEVFPDGRRIQQWADGRRAEVFPDGRRIDHYPNGDHHETLPDGRQLRSLAPPFAFMGRVRGDLVDVTGVPGELGEAGTLTVEGRVSDSVGKVSLAAYRLPDGDVRLEPTRPRDGAFKVAVRLNHPGYYRVQLMGDIGQPANVTMMDRTVKVGEAPDLAPLVLEVRPYPGNEAAAARMLMLIDQARLAAGKRPLRRSAGLTRVAAERLAEMLALDYFSHVSPKGRGVVSLLKAEHVRYRSVGENLGKGGALAEVHHQLMLSAGHRKNLLGRGWSDVGVATAKESGTVWVVEVFGQR